ncbi:type IV secretory system conjugative DNA transfer family protein [Nocardiopsis halophila]|uniref:type IV secretory system conjugative DNA transfer family protein n=1 Tax=Nocardiopsis halophila TaxID=141692 RepID=UPI00034595C4|nr:type IV secretory system conjugative DNA transfer family protein [Nocardiopsis halophila]
MNRDRHGGGGPADLTPLWVLIPVAALVAVLGLVWLGGTLGAWASGAGWDPPPFSPATLIWALRGTDPWPGVATPWIAGGIIAVVLAAAALALAAAWTVPPLLPRRDGFANRRQAKRLTVPAQTAKAQRLRPSLKDRRAKDIAPADAGFALGTMDPEGVELRGSWEDTALVIMGPRGGKTSAIGGPAALEAPGACLVTSNKADIYTLTATKRAEKGRVWCFDPQNITHGHRDDEFYWDMITEARTLEGAGRLAMNLSNNASAGGKGGKGEWWGKAGQSVLRSLFHAAALDPGRGLEDAMRWVFDAADRTPVEILRAHEGLEVLADSLEGTIDGAFETREGIYEHARQAVACLLDPDIRAWVTPGPYKDEFDPAEFVASTDALYLLSKDGGGSAAGIITALTDACLRAGVAEAEACPGQRLDPPMVPVLDEAANVCKIEDLPFLYSHFGSRGITPITILQNYEQGTGVWGRGGMNTLFSASTVKVLGSGVDDDAYADRLSKLVGLHYVTETSVSRSSGSTSTTRSRRRERILDIADVREMKEGTAIVLATSMRPAKVRLNPWYRGPAAEDIARGKDALDEAIVQSARASRRMLR